MVKILYIFVPQGIPVAVSVACLSVSENSINKNRRAKYNICLLISLVSSCGVSDDSDVFLRLYCKGFFACDVYIKTNIKSVICLFTQSIKVNFRGNLEENVLYSMFCKLKTKERAKNTH